MNGYKELQKIALHNLTLRLYLRDLGDKIKYKLEDYDKMTDEELDALIVYYKDTIKEFDESEKYPLF